MDIEVSLTPAHIDPSHLAGKTVVVFDVLRATTTILAAFAAGIRSVRAFADLADAKAAAASQKPRPILCGELHALPAPGVDLGNSPRQFTAEHRGCDMLLCTTNGTKALAAASAASVLLVGALVNAATAAKAAAATHRPVLLLGSGAYGEIAMEDILGAGAVAQHLTTSGKYSPASDTARIAIRLFTACQNDLPRVLRDCQGGRNIIKAGLEPDIDFAARLDAFDIVGAVDTRNLLITPQRPPGGPV